MNLTGLVFLRMIFLMSNFYGYHKYQVKCSKCGFFEKKNQVSFNFST